MAFSNDTIRRCYPEVDFGGYSRVDGTVAFYSRINALLTPKTRLLDIGCGRGSGKHDSCEWRRSLQCFKGRVAHVTGIDPDPAAAANPDLDEFHLIEPERPWPLEDGSINLAVSDFVLEHLEHPDRFFSECHRILAPGGQVCLRTPNKYFYISLIASLIPNRFHAALTSRVQKEREDEDVFPTFYRCNTRRSIVRIMKKAGFDVTVVRHEAEPAYLHFSNLAYRIGALAHRLMPPPLASTLLIYARKR